jgi:hypothetical protein
MVVTLAFVILNVSEESILTSENKSSQDSLNGLLLTMYDLLSFFLILPGRAGTLPRVIVLEIFSLYEHVLNSCHLVARYRRVPKRG